MSGLFFLGLLVVSAIAACLFCVLAGINPRDDEDEVHR